MKRKILISMNYLSELKETKSPCCATQENGLCKKSKLQPSLEPAVALFSSPKSDEQMCQDRASYLFWAELHLTEAVCNNIANRCTFSTIAAGSICSPYDIYHLAYEMAI